jgi:transporter family-2 protein
MARRVLRHHLCDHRLHRHPLIGTAAAVGLTVAGQQIASLFVDRYGWFRLPKREISPLRLGGVAILLVGVALI